MNLLTIKIENNILQLAEVRHIGKKAYIDKVRVFSIPENLGNGGFVKNTEVFADFVVSCLDRGKLKKEKAMILLDISTVFLKEYTHEKSKPIHLLSLASLEADAALPENEGEFIIENEWYGPRKNQKGMQTSAIYAVNERFITRITKDMKTRGIKLAAVIPTTIVHTDIIKKLLSNKISGSEFDNKTVVALDLSHQEIRAIVFHNRELIHQRTDNQIMDEFYRSVATAFNLSLDVAEEYCLKNGFHEESEGNRRDPVAYEEMTQTGVSLVTRMARSIKMILSEENLIPDRIIISGVAAAIPGLAKFINECLGIQCNSINDYYESFSKAVELGGKLKSRNNLSQKNRNNLFQSLVLLAGIDYKRKKNLNFLTRGITRKRNNRRTIFVCTFVFIATLLVMSILHLNYYITY
ncbi:MAG TPA: pilus assembly protein PilM, partial [Anaerovoracaceae bacterium]|nr:pilus assembly protein PilM [Anaerovoracaceae bacterium]